LCYRSGESLSAFVQPLILSLQKIEPEWEVVLVGNYLRGAGDPTPEVVRRLAATNPRIRALTLEKQGMMGWDMRKGLQTATGEVLAVIDGDGQMPFEDVVKGYEMLKRGGYDLVKTYRVKRFDGFYRKLVSRVYNILFKALFPGLNGRDINSKPKLMTRAVFEQMCLESDGWFIDAEIMIQARRLKLRVGEFPTVFHDIETRASFVRPTAIFEFLANLIAHRVKEFRHREKN
jgi:glycosyltransferase involved in cell wall biosynthesis